MNMFAGLGARIPSSPHEVEQELTDVPYTSTEITRILWKTNADPIRKALWKLTSADCQVEQRERVRSYTLTKVWAKKLLEILSTPSGKKKKDTPSSQNLENTPEVTTVNTGISRSEAIEKLWASVKDWEYILRYYQELFFKPIPWYAQPWNIKIEAQKEFIRILTELHKKAGIRLSKSDKKSS
jgi:hypothetical protein